MLRASRPHPLALAGLWVLLCVGPAPAADTNPKTSTSTNTNTNANTSTSASDEVIHPAVRPLPGAKSLARSARNLDEYWMPLGRLIGDGQAERHQMLVGRWTHAAFSDPKRRSVTEVFRHYEQQLTRAGFEIVYACRGVECGEGGRKTNGDWWAMNDNRRFLTARLERPQGNLWVSVHVHARKATTPVHHEVDVIETLAPPKPPPPRDEADVATLARELEADGRVVLRGIPFVEGRPAPGPGAEPILEAIAGLLAREPGLKLHVVVHGDHQDPAADGLELTKKRASALVTLLVRKHGVRADRLRAAGLGPLAPVASHATEEGRALNRRVELVPQGGERSREAAVQVRSGR